jgi:hypothetical protein
LTEEELNRRLQQNDDDESTVMSEMTESTQRDDYAALNGMNNRISSGMLLIQEEAPSN